MARRGCRGGIRGKRENVNGNGEADADADERSSAGLAYMNALYECTLNVREAVCSAMGDEGVEFVCAEEALTLEPRARRSSTLSYCARACSEGERIIDYVLDDARAFARAGPETYFSMSDVRLTQECDGRESYTLMRFALYAYTDEVRSLATDVPLDADTDTDAADY